MDPPLRVREDWWVFERPFFNGKEGRVDFRKNLSLRKYWWVFEKTLKVQGSTGGFSKNLLSIKRGFSKAPFQALFSKK